MCYIEVRLYDKLQAPFDAQIVVNPLHKWEGVCDCLENKDDLDLKFSLVSQA